MTGHHINTLNVYRAVKIYSSDVKKRHINKTITAVVLFTLLMGVLIVHAPAAHESSYAPENPKVIFSHPGGLYEKEFSLTLSSNDEKGIVRFTLNGTNPASDSQLYEKAITIADRTSDANLLSAVTTGFGLGVPGGFGGFGGRGGFSPGRGASIAPAEKVFKGTVVKAAVFSQGGEMLSGISVNSYFVNKDIFKRYGGLPIISIVTEANHFFDGRTGLFVNTDRQGPDWERPVHFEMFKADGTSVISQNMGVRIHGGATRSLAQKAMRFYAREEYDRENTNIKYELFENLTTSNNYAPLAKFKRFILRSSGNDNSGSLFRDALMHYLVNDLNLNTQASRPCVAFINGEFWGIYNIRERFDNHYFASHYNVDKDKIAMLKIGMRGAPEIQEGDAGDLAYYYEMIRFFNNNSMTAGENYKKAQAYLDIDNIIDYFIANIYSANTDWPANNNVFWRYKTDNGGYDDSAAWYRDGRFRWVAYDMDWGFGLMASQTHNTLLHAMYENAGDGMFFGRGGFGGGMGGFTSAESTLMFRKLLENNEFRGKFINRFCDVMNTNYETQTVIAAIDEMRTLIKPAISEQAIRFPGSVRNVNSWEASIETMRQFARERAGYMRGFLQGRFSLSYIAPLTLKTNADAGYIRINNTNIKSGTRGVHDPSSWSGGYFAGTVQTLTAVPSDGRTFVKFIVTDAASGTTTECDDGTIEITLRDGGNIVEAVFK